MTAARLLPFAPPALEMRARRDKYLLWMQNLQNLRASRYPCEAFDVDQGGAGPPRHRLVSRRNFFAGVYR